jgi:cyclic beta-1,2-glucan synthetase
MQRTGIESILGLKVRGDRLQVDPCIPAAWPGFEATLRRGASTYDVAVTNPHGVSRGVVAARLDGAMLQGRPILAPFVDDGAHHRLELTLG